MITTASVSELLKQYIPGGCHTNAKGDDAWPANAPACISGGSGAIVWDEHGQRFVDWGMGLTSVAFGHADPEINQAAKDAMDLGHNFSRPSETEAHAAMRLVEHLGDRGEMVKFAKTGSDVTNAAVRLARAFTGRRFIAMCGDQPFFGSSDWFIGATACCAGILDSVKEFTLRFRYNDLASVRALFQRYPNQIAGVILEPMRFKHPAPGFLETLRSECDQHGSLLIFDEMISGFKFHAQGASKLFGVSGDLYCWGKSLANGHSVAAITGHREVMSRAGIDHNKGRVFFASSTHGAEIPPLAAMMKVLDRVQADPGMFERNRKKGGVLRAALDTLIRENGLKEHLGFIGDDCHFAVDIQRSEAFAPNVAKTFLLQELIARGQLFSGSFFPTVVHDQSILDETAETWAEVLPLYGDFLAQGDPSALIGPPIKPVLRGFNHCACAECVASQVCKFQG